MLFHSTIRNMVANQRESREERMVNGYEKESRSNFWRYLIRA